MSAATARTDQVHAMLDSDESGDLWLDFIDLLCDASPNDYEEGTPAGALAALVVGCSEDEMVALRLSAEICPVHHCDAATCRDDGVGDGDENCGS